MAAESEILKELEELMIERFAEGPAEERMSAFAGCFAASAKLQMKMGATGSEAMTVTLGYLLHACARHPEWLMAVVRDSQWLRDCLRSEEEYEQSNNYFINMYPLPRGVREVQCDYCGTEFTPYEGDELITCPKCEKVHP